MARNSTQTFCATEEMKIKESRILLFPEEDELTVFFLNNGRIAEVWKERRQSVRVGDIYLGRIERYAANIDAYYVEILKGISCFLPAKETEYCGLGKLREGTELLVQIKKEAHKNKLAYATTKLEIVGKYSVISREAPAIHYSKKIDHKKRDILKRIMEENYDCAGQSFNVLLRTASAECEDGMLLLNEIKENENALKQIIAAASHTYPLCKMYGNVSVLEQIFIEGRMKPETKIITKDKGIYERVSGLCWQYGYDTEKNAVLYDDELPLSVLYGLKNSLHEITDEKIWLSCGGSLYITPTEALTVIDVNTGKYLSRENKEDTFLKINLEAAKEVAFQIQARNLSGIIIVDFINMRDKNNTTILIDALRDFLRDCSPQGIVVDMTKLGLIEITREKKHPDIYEIKSELYKTILM